MEKEKEGAGADEKMAPRNNIVLIRRETPKQVTLPDVLTFYTKFKRVKQVDLPAHVSFSKTYKGRPVNPNRKKRKAKERRKLPNWLNTISRRRKARGRKKVTFGAPLQIKKYVKPPQPEPRIVRIPGQGPTLVRPVPGRVRKKVVRHKGRKKQGGKGLGDVARAVANNPYVQEIGKRALTKGINYLPTLSKRGANRIKNKRLRKIAQFRKTNRRVVMSGISNFTIEKFVNEIDDELKNNFVGAFPSDRILKFLKITEMVRHNNTKYPFMIMNTDRSDKKGTYWWSFLEISSKEQIFLFDSYGFIGLKEFIIDDDRETIDRFFYGL